MEKREFIEMNKQNISKFRKRFLSLPPQSNQRARIKNAIENDIPIEFLIKQEIITPKNIDLVSLDAKDYNFVKEYMEHTGIITEGMLTNKTDTENKPGNILLENNEDSQLINNLKLEVELLKEGIKDSELTHIELLERTNNDAYKKKESLNEDEDLTKILREELQRVTIEYDKILIEQDELKIKIDELENKNVSDTECDRKDYSEVLHELTEESDSYRKKVEELTKVIKEKENTENELRKEITDLINKYDFVNNAKTDAERKLELTNEKLTLMEIQIARNDNEKDRVLTSISKAEEIKKESEIKLGVIQEILVEKDTEINEKKDDIIKLKIEIENLKESHSKDLKELIELNEKKLEGYREALMEDNNKEVQSNSIDIDDNTKEKDLARARLEGKKIVSIVGHSSYNIREEMLKILKESTEIFITDDADDADLYVITTNITKKSVERFKEYTKLKDRVIKILVDWDISIPFTPESLVGSKLDYIIDYEKDWYKRTWVEKDPKQLWVTEIEKLIREVI